MMGYEAVIIQGLFKIALALIGIIMGRATLLWFDYWLVGSKFTNWLDKASDIAKGVYYGARFIGVAIIIGCAIS